MARNTASMDGLLIPERCLYTTLETVGAGATDSTYTQATPRPGLPVYADSKGRWEVEVSGAQSEEIRVLCRKSGQPARDGLQLIYQPTDETSGSYRSWETPGLQTGFVPLGDSDWGAQDSSASAICIVPSNQYLIAAVYDTATTEIVVSIIAPGESVSVVQTGYAMDADWGDGIALVVLPDERVLMYVGRKAYYSDTYGASWALFSESITSETVTTYGRTTVVQYRGDLLMLVEDDTTANTIYHFASTDGGASFGLVDTIAGIGRYIDACANDDGIHITWTLSTSTSSRYRHLGSVFEELDAVAATVISNAGSSSFIASDGGGTLYLGWHSTSTAGRLFLVHSVDTGATWSSHDGGWYLDTTSERIWMRGAWQTGRLAMLHGYTSTDMCAVSWSGGWSQAVGAVDDPARHDMARRPGWCARTGTSNADGGVYEPFVSPASMGWTGSGGAAVPAVHASGAAQIASTANELSYSQAPANMSGSVLCRVRVLVSSGGSTTTQAVALVLRVANGVYDYELAIQMATTGFGIYDVNGAATLATVIVTMTSYVDIMVWLDSTGAAKVCHRTPGATTWTTDYNAAGVTSDGATPNANGIIRWGNVATATATSRWREVCWAIGTGTERPRLAMPLDYQNGWGKPINARPEPLPEFADSAGKICHLAVTSGPGRTNDYATVMPYYEHGIHHAHVEVSPSPRAKWRSTSTAEQSTVYDLGDTGWAGHGVGLFVAGANFRTIYLESYSGGAWTTRATLDLASGFTGLAPSLSGDILYPNTATTAAGGRWLWEGELKDGWVKGTAGSTNANRIVTNSSGTWSTAGTVIPVLRMEDGSDLSGVTECALVWPSGLILWYPSTISPTLARYWRWRIPSGTAETDTPTGETYYEAGAILLGRVQPFGAAWSWGKSTEKEPNVERRTSASGTTRARQRGPAVRRWTAGWPDQQNLLHIRASQTAANYVGPASALGMAAHEDVAYLLEGLLDLTDGGARPVVAIENLPATGVVVTDPARFLYGHLTGSVRTTRDTGVDLGTDEVIRTDSVTVVGIP